MIMNHNILKVLFIPVLIFVINPSGICQTEMPDVLQKGSLQEQLNYIEERTRIYEYYRAIREDMFQQIKKNTLDSLTVFKAEIAELISARSTFNLRIDSLNKLITDTRIKMDDAVRTKNNIKVLGMDVNKYAYNSVMWIIIAGLVTLMVIVFLAFKRNLAVTRNTKKDLEDLKTEFEAYRKQSREAREKMSMDHFNELRRLRAHVSYEASPTSEVLTKEVAKEEGEGRNEESNVKKSRKRRPGRPVQRGQGSIEL